MRVRADRVVDTMSELTVRGRPGDDWPGIPGVPWGMGSRVIVKTHSMGELSGIIVGAVAIDSPELWRIHVRLDVHAEQFGPKVPPSAFLPSEILRLASTP